MYNHKTINLPEIKATTTDGVRLYETPEGNKYPSITTVLSVRNKKGLFEWRKRVGDDVANYVARKAATRGTHVHHMCEDYINNDFDEPSSDQVSLIIVVEPQMPIVGTKILEESKKRIIMEEGCLSYPDLFLDIERPESVVVKYEDEGKEVHKIKLRVF